MLDPVVNRLRSIHDRYARVILAGIATLLVPLMALTAAATLDNWQQNSDIKAATAAQDELLVCFDEFAAASSVSSKAVRDASVRKDIATADRDDALNAEGVAFKRLIRHILKEKVSPKDVRTLAKTLEARDDAARHLDRAQAALDKARRENPIPDPPSKFCDIEGAHP